MPHITTKRPHKSVTFRPWPDVRDLLTIAQAHGLTASEIINRALEHEADSLLARLERLTTLQQQNKAAGAPPKRRRSNPKRKTHVRKPH